MCSDVFESIKNSAKHELACASRNGECKWAKCYASPLLPNKVTSEDMLWNRKRRVLHQNSILKYNNSG